MIWRNQVGTAVNGICRTLCCHLPVEDILHRQLAAAVKARLSKVCQTIWARWAWWFWWLRHSGLFLGSIEYEMVNIVLLVHSDFVDGVRNNRRLVRIWDKRGLYSPSDSTTDTHRGQRLRWAGLLQPWSPAGRTRWPTVAGRSAIEIVLGKQISKLNNTIVYTWYLCAIGYCCHFCKIHGVRLFKGEYFKRSQIVRILK